VRLCTIRSTASRVIAGYRIAVKTNAKTTAAISNRNKYGSDCDRSYGGSTPSRGQRVVVRSATIPAIDIRRIRRSDASDAGVAYASGGRGAANCDMVILRLDCKIGLGNSEELPSNDSASICQSMYPPMRPGVPGTSRGGRREFNSAMYVQTWTSLEDSWLRGVGIGTGGLISALDSSMTALIEKN